MTASGPDPSSPVGEQVPRRIEQAGGQRTSSAGDRVIGLAPRDRRLTDLEIDMTAESTEIWHITLDDLHVLA